MFHTQNMSHTHVSKVSHYIHMSYNMKACLFLLVPAHICSLFVLARKAVVKIFEFQLSYKNAMMPMHVAHCCDIGVNVGRDMQKEEFIGKKRPCHRHMVQQKEATAAMVLPKSVNTGMAPHPCLHATQHCCCCHAFLYALPSTMFYHVPSEQKEEMT